MDQCDTKIDLLKYMWVSDLYFIRVATGQGNFREIWFFFKVREKTGNFTKLVREILNTKKVREFYNFGPKYVL